MVGSAAIGGVIAHVAFWLLLALGWRELRGRTIALFVAAWLTAWLGLPLIGGELFFVPIVAVLDIVLVLLVFNGDVRLT